jgi:class 3 adenylate cyclase
MVQWFAKIERAGASPGSMLALFRANYETDVRPILATIQVPTLVLHRAGDRIVQAAAGRYLADQIPKARYRELPGIDHHVLDRETMDLLADEIEDFNTGARHRPEPDRVLATVMFTDIVGSTTRAAQLGDRRWRELLESFYQVMRKELSVFRGREVDTAGDGMLAAFDGPARAVRCACAAREKVRQLGLDVRTGLHTGECELIGDRVSGIAVHIGARVASTANPSEVLVSSTVKDLVAGSGIQFADRGAHALEGVPGEWRLFAVQ